jgi:hypothetical protein
MFATLARAAFACRSDRLCREDALMKVQDSAPALPIGLCMRRGLGLAMPTLSMTLEETMNNDDYGLGDDHQPKRNIRKRVRHATLPVNFPTTKAVAGTVRARLPLMADGLLHLDTDPYWTRISPYPVRIEFLSQDKNGRFVVAAHVPDIGVISRDGRKVFIDYVPLVIQRERPHLARRTELLKEIFREEHGAAYAVHDERSIYIEPRFSNLKTMWMHKLNGWDIEALMAVRKALGRLSMPAMIDEVRQAASLPGFRMVWEQPDGESHQDLDNVDRAFSAVMELAMNGEVQVDLSEPFSGTTLVSRYLA